MATIWGKNKWGLPRCYYLNCPPSEVKEAITRAKEDGWTELVVDHNPQPALWDEDSLSPDDSESSESETSPTTRKSRSRTSGAASQPSVTPSSSSRRRVRPTR